jgi:hypothetical protein
MKFCQLAFVSALLTLPANVSLAEGASPKTYAAKETTCKQGENTRKVKLGYKDESQGSDCSVSYQKESDQAEKVLWSAQKQPDFCKEKADAFVEKLKGMGWACD